MNMKWKPKAVYVFIAQLATIPTLYYQHPCFSCSYLLCFIPSSSCTLYIGFSCCSFFHSMFNLIETIATKRTPLRRRLYQSQPVARGDFAFQCGQSEICSRGRCLESTLPPFFLSIFKEPRGNLSGLNLFQDLDWSNHVGDMVLLI